MHLRVVIRPPSVTLCYCEHKDAHVAGNTCMQLHGNPTSYGSLHTKARSDIPTVSYRFSMWKLSLDYRPIMEVEKLIDGT